MYDKASAAESASLVSRLDRFAVEAGGMIDLHSHILPGLDDGAATIAVSLEMARMAAARGVSVMACTPHILPGAWNNSGPDIRLKTKSLQASVDDAGIPVRLVPGAEVHVAFDLVARLRSGQNLSLADSRYVLLEMPHHVAPSRIEGCFFACKSAGYVPILAHPERLGWIDGRYDKIKRLASAGVWMQVTAGSLTGTFGRRARYWAQRMLDDGIVHILATDAHDAVERPPILHEGWQQAEVIVGCEEALHLVLTRPLGILENSLPNILPLPRCGASFDVEGEGAYPESANACRADLFSDSRRFRRGMRNLLRWRRAG